MSKSCQKVYRVEVFPEPYVYCVETNSKDEARKQIKRMYPDGNYKIVVTTMRYRMKRKEKNLLNKMKIDEILD